MSAMNYLESLPLNEIARRGGGPPQDGVLFSGYPRQSPADKNKLILVYEPLGQSPAVLEFMLEDVLYVEELHSAVTEAGEGLPLVRLWVRRGAHGVLMEPFEVDDPARFATVAQEFRERFPRQRRASPRGR
jgi:hypothetical protein